MNSPAVVIPIRRRRATEGIGREEEWFDWKQAIAEEELEELTEEGVAELEVNDDAVPDEHPA